MAGPFGYYLAIDLYGCDKEIIDSVNAGYMFLEELVVLLKMDKACPPLVFRGDEEMYPEKGQGISAFVALIQSGIQLHTVTGKQFVSVDIYTCGQLDKKAAIDFCVRYFKAEDAEVNYLERGTRY